MNIRKHIWFSIIWNLNSILCWKWSIHPHDKLDVGYRLSLSGLAVTYGYTNITYLGPIIADISVAIDSSKVNVTYSNVASSSIELRNRDGFEVCCLFLQWIIITIISSLRYVVLEYKCVTPLTIDGCLLQLVELKEHHWPSPLLYLVHAFQNQSMEFVICGEKHLAYSNKQPYTTQKTRTYLLHHIFITFKTDISYGNIIFGQQKNIIHVEFEQFF
jgi:hypothetical protein